MTLRLFLQALLCITFALQATRADEKIVEDSVFILTEANFDASLQRFEFLAVYFYMPG